MNRSGFFAWAFLCAFCAAACSSVRGEPPAAPSKNAQTNPPHVQVLVLRDAGGLPTDGRDKRLNEQFSAGLRSYLSEAAKQRFVVADSQNRFPGDAQSVFTVEGEMSRASNGKEGGPFLVALRLCRKNEAAPRRVIAQWSGKAENYRYLTGNLDNRTDIDREGLLGELGKRVTDAILATDENAAFNDLVDRAAQSGRVSATLLPDTPPLQGEQGFRLEIKSKESGAVFVVRDDEGRLFPLLVPGEKEAQIVIEAGKPQIVPGKTEAAWIVPRPKTALPQTLVILVRRSSNNSNTSAPNQKQATPPSPPFP